MSNSNLLEKRNREIVREFRILQESKLPVHEITSRLGRRYFLSARTVKNIVYNYIGKINESEIEAKKESIKRERSEIYREVLENLLTEFQNRTGPIIMLKVKNLLGSRTDERSSFVRIQKS